jgi:hypothetical protein
MLNIALFGKTAKQWKNEWNSSGNMRDIATIQQLIVLANMESMNAELIRQWFDQSKRISLLNQLAIQQMKSLLESHSNLSL